MIFLVKVNMNYIILKYGVLNNGVDEVMCSLGSGMVKAKVYNFEV
jgi:hypothetical protein